MRVCVQRSPSSNVRRPMQHYLHEQEREAVRWYGLEEAEEEVEAEDHNSSAKHQVQTSCAGVAALHLRSEFALIETTVSAEGQGEPPCWG
jgi:hypothetical protein